MTRTVDPREAAEHFRALVEGAAEQALRGDAGGAGADGTPAAAANDELRAMKDTKHIPITKIFIYAKDLRRVMVAFSEKLTDEEARGRSGNLALWSLAAAVYFERTTRAVQRCKNERAVQRCKNEPERCSYDRDRGPRPQADAFVRECKPAALPGAGDGGLERVYFHQYLTMLKDDS